MPYFFQPSKGRGSMYFLLTTPHLLRRQSSASQNSFFVRPGSREQDLDANQSVNVEHFGRVENGDVWKRPVSQDN